MEADGQNERMRDVKRMQVEFRAQMCAGALAHACASGGNLTDCGNMPDSLQSCFGMGAFVRGRQLRGGILGGKTTQHSNAHKSAQGIVRTWARPRPPVRLPSRLPL